MVKLKSGDFVELIAPSFPVRKDQGEKGILILEQWGLKPKWGGKKFSPWIFHSQNNKTRSFFLNQAFLSKNSSAVWMLRGGYGLQKLMPSFIENHHKHSKNKLFIGYSDGTALHLYLNKKNRKTLHAPTVCELPDLSQSQLSLLKSILFAVEKEICFKNLTLFKKTPENMIKALIRGGNLSLLSSSVGTKWFPSLQSCFLFVEDVNESDYKIDRLLHHLFHSGVLKGVKALLFGSFSPLSSKILKTRVLRSFFDRCSIPMVFGLPCGHKKENCPLPLNSSAELLINGMKAELKIKLGR